MSRQHRASNLTFLLLALVIFLCMNWIWRLNRQSEELVYSEVVQLFEQEKVKYFSVEMPSPPPPGSGKVCWE